MPKMTHINIFLTRTSYSHVNYDGEGQFGCLGQQYVTLTHTDTTICDFDTRNFSLNLVSYQHLALFSFNNDHVLSITLTK